MALACAPNQLIEVYTLGVIQEQRRSKYYYHPHRNHWNSKINNYVPRNVLEKLFNFLADVKVFIISWIIGPERIKQCISRIETWTGCN